MGEKTIHLKSLETFRHAFTCMSMVLGYFIKLLYWESGCQDTLCKLGPSLPRTSGECQRMVLGPFSSCTDASWIEQNSACFRSRFWLKGTLTGSFFSIWGVRIHGFSDIFFLQQIHWCLGRVGRVDILAFFLAIPVFMRALMKWIPGCRCPWWCLHQVWSDLLF